MGEESPKNKVKFLCSYGGKVLPRPSDGHLRYVGGETRVVCVGRGITFQELMKKVSSMVDGEMILKYQLIPEDLDALVSVKTEEDVKHMIEEHDRHHQTGALLRAFLFPPPKHTGLVVSCEPYMLEQRYIDAINGIIRTSPRKGSACSSPKSNSPDAADHYSPHFSLQRVQSSPSLSGLDYQNQNQNHRQHHPFHNYSRPPHDPSQLGMGIRLGGRSPTFNYHYSRQQPHRDRERDRGGGGGGYSPYYDDSAAVAAVAYAHDRIHTLSSRSPRRKTVWE